MARPSAIKLVVLFLMGCSHHAAMPPRDDSPEFNNCWNMFPPGPDFQRQIEEYMGTNDRNLTVLGCLPLYPLDQKACSDFKSVGVGEWPDDVVDWCRKYFDIELSKM